MRKNKNSNIEFLNFKQILMTQIINSKQFGTLEYSNLDIVSDLEVRIY